MGYLSVADSRAVARSATGSLRNVTYNESESLRKVEGQTV